MGEEVEEGSLRAQGDPRGEGDPQPEQDVADVTQARIRQHSFDNRLPKGKKISIQDIQRAKEQQEQTPGNGGSCQYGQRPQHGDQADLDHHPRQHGTDPARRLGMGVGQPGMHRDQRHFDSETDQE